MQTAAAYQHPIALVCFVFFVMRPDACGIEYVASLSTETFSDNEKFRIDFDVKQHAFGSSHHCNVVYVTTSRVIIQMFS